MGERESATGELSPAGAVARLSDAGDTNPKATILRLLREGVARACAEKIVADTQPIRTRWVGERVWTLVDIETASFWNEGWIHVLIPKDGGLPTSYSAYGIRLDLSAVLSNKQADPPVRQGRKNPLSAKEAERFCRSVLHGWPDITEREVYTKAVQSYPENKVSRDPFIAIFRSIRGPKKPGRPPK